MKPVFVFDGTFEGLLTAVHEAYYSGRKPGRIASELCLQTSLLEEYVRIPTDAVKSEKVYAAIRSKISERALEQVYHVFLSNLPDAANTIYEYLRLGFSLGPKSTSTFRTKGCSRYIKRASEWSTRCTNF
jgi:hypothetical protein